MGNILKIFRKRRAPSEELDELVLQIKELESQLKNLLDCRAWSLKWILNSTLCIVGATSTYYWFQHSNLRRKFLLISTIVFLGLSGFFLTRFILISIFDSLIVHKQRRIRIFTERKVAIIEDVKENEKFKVAKEIIEKYGSHSEVKEWLGTTLFEQNDSQSCSSKIPNSTSGISEQNVTQSEVTKPIPKLYEIPGSGRVVKFNHTPIRPFMEESRTPIDRILDLVMGENINNRYALICANCHTHNGMALQEEFESISYSCYKCNFFNPSKAELNRRFPRINEQLRNLNFTSHTDESTENENESNRKASTVSTSSELS